MSDRDYAIRYQVERGLWTKAELAPHGGADALLICSILRQPSGGVSYQWLTPNGDAAIPIPAHELFSAWLILGEGLARQPMLIPELRTITEEALTKARNVIALAKLAACGRPPWVDLPG